MTRFRDEIGQQPDLAARLIESSQPPLDAIAAAFKARKPQGFVIAARGSSDHAADYARYLFGRRHRALVSLAAPSMFTHYATPPSLKDQCVIGISQSGASPDVIAVVDEAKRQGVMSIAITNDDQHALAEDAELHALLATPHQLPQGFAHDPHAAALVAEHPSPSASARFLTGGVARKGNRTCACDQRYALVQAGRGEDQAGVMHDGDTRARQQAFEQILQATPGGRDLRAGGAGAAGGGSRRAKLGDERRETLLHDMRINERQVGAGA